MSPTISCIFHNWDRMYHINNGSVRGGGKEIKELMGDLSEWEGGGRDWKGEKGKMSYFYESHLQTN